MKTNAIDVDLLVIGSGSAGLWAALRHSEVCPDNKILIVDKGPRDWGGLMSMAGGDFEAVIAPDSIRSWLEDYVYYFDGLCDQPLMEKLLAESQARFDDYQSFGCEFFHNPDGSLKSVPQRGLSFVKLYPARLKGLGGQMMVGSLIPRLKERGVMRLGRVMLLSYLVKDGRIYGAIGFDTIEGDFVVIRAQAVIAATGMGGWKTSYGKNTPTGEGLKMAWEAGAVLHNLEFARVWNMPRRFAWEGQTHLFPLGARFLNRLGENFMASYSSTLGPNTDPHFTTIGMALEIRAGRGPIIFDVSGLKQEDMILLKPQNGWQKLNYEKLREQGLDLFRDNTEWTPQITVSHGGIHANADGVTEVDGLFAAGTARSLEPGVYAGGLALMMTAVTGHLSGQAAADWIRKNRRTLPEISPAEIGKMASEMFAPLRDAKNSLAPKDVLTKIQAAIFPYSVSIIKNAKALREALTEIERIEAEDIPRMRARDPHYLLKLREVEAIAFVSHLYLEASLLRRESRAGHFREDYPHLDPKGPAWLYLENDGGKKRFVWRSVPLKDYPVPLVRCYQDNFNFSTR